MKVLYITPHLSTGGAPRYLLEKIRLLNDLCDIYCIEYTDITGGVLIVQKSEIQKLLGNKLITIGENKYDIIKEINRIAPDVVHFEEMPEYFCDYEVAKQIYNANRTYKIFETSHDSSFNANNKLFFPDKFLLISEYQRRLFQSIDVPSEIVEFPITYKKKSDRASALRKLNLDPNYVHIINVGLFTPRKNQKELIEYARKLVNLPVRFHFIGSLADNFKFYWEDAIKDLPSNCVVWGERADVDNFYDAADLFFFASRGFENDKETSPLVIRECIGWNVPIFLYNLPVYCDMYNKYDNMMFLSLDKDTNLNSLREKIVSVYNEQVRKYIDPSYFTIDFSGEENKFWVWCRGCSSLLPEMKIHTVYKDIDSLTTFYSIRNNNFNNGGGVWAIPMQQNYEFGKDKNFRGFLVEFYDLNYNLLFTKELFTNNSAKNPDKIEFSLLNPFDRPFWNFQEMFVNKNIEKQFPSLNFQDLDVVLDAGANNGIFIEKMLLAGVKKIYGFEPNPNALRNLNHRYSSNLRVEIIDKAVSDTNGKCQFFYHPDNSTISAFDKNHISFHLPENEIVNFEVDTVKLDSFCDSKKIDYVDLIKIDIEGAEYMVLHSLDSSFYKKVKYLLIEIHENRNDEVKNLISYLRSLDFEINTFAIREESCSESELLNSLNGMFLATNKKLISSNKNKEIKAALVTDVFFHSECNYLNFFEYANNMKKTGLPLLLMTNSKFDNKVLDHVDYLIYDKEDRLFKDKYSQYKSIVLFCADSKYAFRCSIEEKQKHGLSVLSNIYRSLIYLKSLNYTHIIKTEADCLLENPERINDELRNMVDSNKKGLIYLHKDGVDLFTSCHVLYFDIDFLLSLYPQINNEKDYQDFIDCDKFIIAEVFFTKVIQQKIDEIIIKDSNLIFTDYGEKSLWNRITSPVESDKLINGCIPNIFRVYINDVLQENVFAVALIKINDTNNNCKFIVNINGEETEYNFSIDDVIAYEFAMIKFDKKPTIVTMIKDDFTKIVEVTNVMEIDNTLCIKE
jgi:FkbM family methyltransferase